MDKTTLNIEQSYVVLTAQQQAKIELADAEVFQRLDNNYAGFQGCQLICCYQFDQSWPSWERHPAGDETVILLSGRVTVVLQQDNIGQSDEQLVLLEKPGDFVIVPKNTWHSARTEVNSKLLFITPGEGTQHKPL
jgi:mannose-6-phosphate isomerase-like protein (cupin superfamily)